MFLPCEVMELSGALRAALALSGALWAARRDQLLQSCRRRKATLAAVRRCRRRLSRSLPALCAMIFAAISATTVRSGRRMRKITRGLPSGAVLA